MRGLGKDRSGGRPEGGAGAVIRRGRKSPRNTKGTKTNFSLASEEKSWYSRYAARMRAAYLYPGIAKLVSRLVWDQETVRASRTTRTKIPLKSMISEGFFLFFVYCGAKFEVCRDGNEIANISFSPT